MKRIEAVIALWALGAFKEAAQGGAACHAKDIGPLWMQTGWFDFSAMSRRRERYQ